MTEPQPSSETAPQRVYSNMNMVCFHNDDAKIITGHESMKPKAVYVPEEGDFFEIMDIKFFNITTNVFNNPIFEYLNLEKCTQLAIFNAVVPIALLQACAAKMPNIRVAKFENFENNEKLTEIVPLFPNLKSLSIPHVYSGWAKDLLDMNVEGFHYMGSLRHGCAYDDIFSFQKDELVELLRRDCFIALHLENKASKSLEDQTQDIVSYLEPMLRRTTSSRRISRRFHLVLDRPVNTPAGSPRTPAWLFFILEDKPPPSE